MTFGLLLLAGGIALTVSAITGSSVIELLTGTPGSKQGPDGFARIFDIQAFKEKTEAEVSGGGGSATESAKDVGVLFDGSTKGGAKGIVDQGAAIGKKNGCKVISGLRAGANTSSGNVSDHSENNANRAARDISNGSNPTPGMDKTCAEIAKAFGTSVNSKSQVVKSWQHGGFRLQLLYRTSVGGNHFNHVHFGAHKA